MSRRRSQRTTCPPNWWNRPMVCSSTYWSLPRPRCRRQVNSSDAADTRVPSRRVRDDRLRPVSTTRVPEGAAVVALVGKQHPGNRRAAGRDCPAHVGAAGPLQAYRLADVRSSPAEDDLDGAGVAWVPNSLLKPSQACLAVSCNRSASEPLFARVRRSPWWYPGGEPASWADARLRFGRAAGVPAQGLAHANS
jgi:hypothetical protein